MLTLSPHKVDNPEDYGRTVRRWGVPPRLWSLWDMIRFQSDNILLLATTLEMASKATMTESQAQQFWKLLPAVSRACVELNLATTLKHIEDIEVTAGGVSESHAQTIQLSPIIRAEFSQLGKTLRRELSTKLLLAIPKEAASELFENSRPFDSDTVSVNERFASAVYDIQEAANCLALSRPTACVFHLMRVLEVGLNALATDLRIPWPDRNDWQDVVNAIEAKIKEIEKGSIKFDGWHEKRQFYADTATQFTHFKDGWRNYAIHFHAVYDDGKAEIVFASVREFMRVLATRLSSVS